MPLSWRSMLSLGSTSFSHAELRSSSTVILRSESTFNNLWLELVRHVPIFLHLSRGQYPPETWLREATVIKMRAPDFLEMTDVPDYDSFCLVWHPSPLSSRKIILSSQYLLFHRPREKLTRHLGVEGRISAQHDIKDNPQTPHVTTLRIYVCVVDKYFVNLPSYALSSTFLSTVQHLKSCWFDNELSTCNASSAYRRQANSKVSV